MQNVCLVNKQKDCNWDPGSMNADDLQYAVEWDRIQMKEQSNRIITRNLACRVKRQRIGGLYLCSGAPEKKCRVGIPRKLATVVSTLSMYQSLAT